MSSQSHAVRSINVTQVCTAYFHGLLDTLLEFLLSELFACFLILGSFYLLLDPVNVMHHLHLTVLLVPFVRHELVASLFFFYALLVALILLYFHLEERVLDYTDLRKKNADALSVDLLALRQVTSQ